MGRYLEYRIKSKKEGKEAKKMLPKLERAYRECCSKSLYFIKSKCEGFVKEMIEDGCNNTLHVDANYYNTRSKTLPFTKLNIAKYYNDDEIVIQNVIFKADPKESLINLKTPHGKSAYISSLAKVALILEKGQYSTKDFYSSPVKKTKISCRLEVPVYIKYNVIRIGDEAPGCGSNICTHKMVLSYNKITKELTYEIKPYKSKDDKEPFYLLDPFNDLDKNQILANAIFCEDYEDLIK